MSRTIFLMITLQLISACFLLPTPDPTPTTNPNPDNIEEDVPTHPPNTEAQWQQLEKQANQLLRSPKAGDDLVPAKRFKKTGLVVEHRMMLKGKRCYTLALAWSFPMNAKIYVGFLKGPDGTAASQYFSGRRFYLEPPQGTLSFCTDAHGEILVTIEAIKKSGQFAGSHELLEYVVASTSRKESPSEAAARRVKEKKEADQASDEIEGNLAEAKATKARDLAERCQQCRAEYRTCQVDRAHERQHPRPGVKASATCESSFQLCAFGGSHFNARRGLNRGEKPCGDPPE